MSANQLRAVRAEWFESLTSLENLHLGKNIISGFGPDKFLWPENVLMLDLHNNKMSLVPPLSVNRCFRKTSGQCQKKRVHVLLQGNDIYCGCKTLPQHDV